MSYDRADEAIAAPRQRLDPVLAVRYAREHAAYGGDLDGQVGLFDHDAGPCGVHDDALLDVFAGAADQRGEHCDPPRTKLGRDTVVSQYPCFGVQPERSQLVDSTHPITVSGTERP